LEIGSGYGGMCRLALKAGIPWEGIDLSRDAAEYCRAAGLPVTHSSLSELRGAFDVIVMCFVFEHLSSYDGFLSACRERLKPGGRIVTLHPTAEFARFAATLLRGGDRGKLLPKLDFAFTPPWHTCLMSGHGIDALARRNGFRVESIRPSPVGRFGSLARKVAQVGIGLVNSVGWRVGGVRWPFIPAYLVVLQRAD
jgi:cyclopropane fatty-acyl-phospholipid synthase-like methyltransferase